GDPMEEARGLEGFDKGDRRFVEALVAGVRDSVSELQGLIVPHLDRDLARLSPVERSILYIGAFELVAHPETPFKVVLNAGLELAITTDMLVEGRHFLPDAAARSLGHKALAVNLSDLAAMGAAPRWALLALGLPSADAGWLEAFSAGFFALAERYGVELIGGDTSRANERTISIVALGEVPAGVALYRSGAKAGDDIWVSGELGGAALALRRPEVAEVARRLHEPEPRVELGERLR